MRRTAMLALVGLLALPACDTRNIGNGSTPSGSPPLSTPSSSSTTTTTTSTTTSTTLPTAPISGSFSGEITVESVLGDPPYTAQYTLTFDLCGTAAITQVPDQTSVGTYTVDTTKPGLLRLRLFGEGPEYREEYLLDLLDGATAQLRGFTLGGGHGFGDVMDPDVIDEAIEAFLDAVINADPAVSGPEGLLDMQIGLDALIALFDEQVTPAFGGYEPGWAGPISGTLTRTGDGPDCTE